MKDRYLDFVNSPFGASVARSIGLPQPEVLRRHAPGRAEFGGITAIGAGPSPTLFEPLITLLNCLGMTSVAHESALGWLAGAGQHVIADHISARRRALAVRRRRPRGRSGMAPRPPDCAV